MRNLSHTGRIISIFWRSSVQNNWLSVLRVNFFSSNITPVKMAAIVFESSTTDRNLPPLIIMHGLFGSKQNWRATSKGLEKKTRRKIYAVDARNHGDSPHTEEHTSAHMSADVAQLMHTEGIQRTSVLGHSMGGRTMMSFTQHNPHLVEKAIIVDISPVSAPPNLDEIEIAIRAMKNVKVSSDLSISKGRDVAKHQLKKTIHDAGAVDFILGSLKKSKRKGFIWAINLDAMVTSLKIFRDVQQFNMPPHDGPMLFIKGTRSAFLKDEDWPKILKIFPNAKLEGLDAGHLVHAERSDEFIDLVTKFLNR